MRGKNGLWKLYRKESIMLFKNPLIYLYIIVLAILICSTNQTLLKEPYDTKVKYEEKLGYITFEELQNLSETDFVDKFLENDYKISSNSLVIYEDNMNYDERIKFFETKDLREREKILQEYIAQGKIVNYRVVDYKTLQSLSKEEYEAICHSLYVPYLSGSLLYFWNGTISTETVYPTYEQAMDMLKDENISGFIAREYYFRMETLFAIITVILLISTFMKDYYNNILIYIKSTNVKSYQYILSKYLTVTSTTLMIYFSLTCISIKLMSPDYSNSLWTFSILDFVQYFILLPLITQLFLNALATLIIVITEDIIFSVALTFYYIFLMGQPTYFKNGSSEWIIKPLKYFPRVNSKIGIMQQVGDSMLNHQIVYLGLAIIILSISIYIWEKKRIKGTSL